MVCVPPVPPAHTVGAVSFVAHLQSLRAAGVHLTLTLCPVVHSSLFSVRAKIKQEVAN